MAMGLHLLQVQFILAILLIFLAKSISSSNTGVTFPIAKPNCDDHCANVTIPFPFGTKEGCYFNSSFLVTCNDTCYNPPKAFLRKSNIEITNISLDGQLRILQFIGKACYARNRTRMVYDNPWMRLSRGLTVSNTANKFTVIGCDTNAIVYGNRLNKNEYRTGCRSWCNTKDDLEDDEGSCSGLGCCQVPIPKEVRTVNVTLWSPQNHTNVWDFNNCSYAFLVEQSAFRFSPGNFSSLRDVKTLPILVDWSIGDGTCEEARKNSSSYACKSTNSKCEKHNNGYGYRCSCQNGYQGNPYFINGCQEIDECKDPSLNDCEKDRCVNTQGDFKCVCPKGYQGDGKKDGRGCIRGQSLVLKLVAGNAIGVIVLLLAACCIYVELNRRKFVRMKHKFFLQNGGLLLQEQLIRRDKSPDTAKIFSSEELKKATNNFHDSVIIGQGGFGTVYKGILANNKIVAIKKSKEVDLNQIEQFINEVIVLSQINHKNVVRLLGCCLETQVPLLVYEFINNGTLFEHINNKTKARVLSWDKRLTVAAEAAGVLAYLHSAASPPIIHRDIKSANILLDTNFTAKVSDFGASRLVPLDQTQLPTMVQGTFGYLDPEYMQTNQLTEKSDVYSFGVVLVELLTGKKALSYDRPEEERNLASYFLSTLKQGSLFKVLDDNIVCEGNNEELIAVSMLAKMCLYVRGEDRPSMKEVAMELERLRLLRKHYLVQTQPNSEEMESLLSEPMNDFRNGEGSSIGIGYDSMRNHIPSPISGGR
ncbi:Wall-associated receptor kinase 2 [Abeliophyllum distichum]|uniref:Wall-associated receptor kinase 2 n=1 Tax=Abeliophyllum distichum TaxID=126358 RepID=A0ABD1STG4_9LAMI